MRVTPFYQNYDHLEDVFTFIMDSIKAQSQAALVIVTNTQGGSVRSVGTMVAVNDQGNIAGHISNGCLDHALIHEAMEACKDNKVRSLSFGKGAAYQDIKLPCGGRIDLLVYPNPEADVIARAYNMLKNRQMIQFTVGLDRVLCVQKVKNRQQQFVDMQASDSQLYQFIGYPKIRIRIMGAGAEMLALSALALTSGFEVKAQSPRMETLNALQVVGVQRVDYLTTPQSIPDVEDDPWTAVVLMFHDHDWEINLLMQAIAQPAFYIGALGSRRTHVIRCQRLEKAGIKPEDIQKIHGPIGLVSSLRSASHVAISTLAEIIDAYQKRYQDDIQ